MTVLNTIQEMIDAKSERLNVTSRIKDGKYEYYHKGRWIDQECFDILFPEVEYQKPNPKGENKCKRGNFIKSQKSY